MASQIRLRGLTGNFDGQIWASTTLLRAGRLSTLEMVLDENSVSRRHAEIRLNRERWTLTDLGSTNGTYLNGGRLASGQCLLKTNDLVRFGNVTFVVEGIVRRRSKSRGAC